MEAEEERLRAWTKAVTTEWNHHHHAPSHDDDDHDDTTNNASMTTTRKLQQTMDSFQREVQLLEDACQQQEMEELAHLRQLYQEQLLLSHQLDETDLQHAKEQNALELQGRAFDTIQAHQTKRYQHVLREVQALEQVDLLSNVMIQWNIMPYQQPQHNHHDPYHQQQQQQYQYPRVNDLRLAFSATAFHDK